MCCAKVGGDIKLLTLAAIHTAVIRSRFAWHDVGVCIADQALSSAGDVCRIDDSDGWVEACIDNIMPNEIQGILSILVDDLLLICRLARICSSKIQVCCCNNNY